MQLFVVASLCTSASVALALDSVVAINEIHYNPGNGGSEFVELVNQTGLPLDISDWRLSGGINFTFPQDTEIEANAYFIVAKNPSEFAGITAFGPFTGRLANGGETIRLRNNNDRVMDLVEYNDRAPWPVSADGFGASLSKIKPLGSGTEATSWTHSFAIGGTPGVENMAGNFVPPSSLRLNEFSAPGAGFWAEVYNPGETAAPVAGLEFRSDSGAIYTVPAGTPDVAAGGFAAFDLGAAGFLPPAQTSIALASATAIIDTMRTRDTGVARIPDGSPGEAARIVLTTDATPGEANGVTLETAIVINEIMYHARPQFLDERNNIPFVESDEEWIELYNNSAAAVDISGWRLDEAISFTFPANTMIPSGGYLVIAGDAIAFAAKFPDAELAGEFSGGLSNSRETILLRDASGNITDRVRYYDRTPWPEAPDAGGSSLELIDADADNDNPGAWAASSTDDASTWQTYTIRATAEDFPSGPPIQDFHELRIGLLNGGELFLDDLIVTEDPDGAATQILQNGTFEDDDAWRFLGSHEETRVVTEDGDSVLRIVATDNYTYLNNQLETTFRSGGALHPIVSGTEYEISFRAKWITGSPQLRFEFYYNKVAELVILEQPSNAGTPGAVNSTVVANAGPSLSGLRHEPIFPSSNQSVTVSAQVSDPDGVASVNLFYSSGSGSTFVSVPMSDTGGGLYTAQIPGRSGSGVPVQFYVEATDMASASAFLPLAGPDSRAVYLVGSNNGSVSGQQAIHLSLTAADRSRLRDGNRLFSNARLGCTVVHNGETVHYDSSVRLRGGVFSRRNLADAGLNIRFPSDSLFKGRLRTVTVRLRLTQEAFVKHMINTAGGHLHDNYNDAVAIRGNFQSQTRARLELARFSRDYAGDLSDYHGEGGTVFKMEGSRIFRRTLDGTPEGLKTANAIGLVRDSGITDVGDSKERYRNFFPINSNRDKDDYVAMVALNKLLDLEGEALETAAEEVMDVDLWMRQFALLSLLDIGDTYTRGNPHNLNFYIRPTDGKIEPMPWDWDQLYFSFGTSALGVSGIFATPRPTVTRERNLLKLIQRPRVVRLFYGHLLNHLDTIGRKEYFDRWANALLGTAFQSSFRVSAAQAIDWRTDREEFLRSEIPEEFPFELTTSAPAVTSSSIVTLAGRGYFNVRTIFANGNTFPLEVNWLNSTDFEVDVPVSSGMSTVTLVARDFEGAEVGTASIAVNSSSAVASPDSTNLVISEIYYHPVNDVREEFIEVMNISSTASLDLTGLRFTDGITYSFPEGTMLAPGERIVVVEDEMVFETSFDASVRRAGPFEGGLRNGGENIRLEIGGLIVQEFEFSDDPPWPKSPDGQGASLVLIAPTSAPDHTNPASWRASIAGATPGSAEATIPFTGDFDGDDNNDGLPNLVNYVLGGSDSAGLFALRMTSAGRAVFTFPRIAAAEDAEIEVEISSDLASWDSGTSELEISGQVPLSAGRELISYRTVNPVPAGSRRFFRLRVTGR